MTSFSSNGDNHIARLNNHLLFAMFFTISRSEEVVGHLCDPILREHQLENLTAGKFKQLDNPYSGKIWRGL